MNIDRKFSDILYNIHNECCTCVRSKDKCGICAFKKMKVNYNIYDNGKRN